MPTRKMYRALKRFYLARFMAADPGRRCVLRTRSTEAGGQGLLAREAGLDDLEPARYPSHQVRDGPLPFPSSTNLTSTCSRKRRAGRTSRAPGFSGGARLSGCPWSFGYTPDLISIVWRRIPWIELWHGRFILWRTVRSSR